MSCAFSLDLPTLPGKCLEFKSVRDYTERWMTPLHDKKSFPETKIKTEYAEVVAGE